MSRLRGRDPNLRLIRRGEELSLAEWAALCSTSASRSPRPWTMRTPATPTGMPSRRPPRRLRRFLEHAFGPGSRGDPQKRGHVLRRLSHWLSPPATGAHCRNIPLPEEVEARYAEHG